MGFSILAYVYSRRERKERPKGPCEGALVFYFYFSAQSRNFDDLAAIRGQALLLEKSKGGEGEGGEDALQCTADAFPVSCVCVCVYGKANGIRFVPRVLANVILFVPRVDVATGKVKRRVRIKSKKLSSQPRLHANKV